MNMGKAVAVLCGLIASCFLPSHSSGERKAPANNQQDRRRVQILVEQLQDPSKTYEAVRELENLGPLSKDAVPALEKILGSSDNVFDRYRVATALMAISGRSNEPAGSFLKQFKKNQSLIEAAAKGDTAEVRRQLDDGADVNARYLDFGAFLDPGMNEFTALMWAGLAGHEKVVQVLLEAKADVSLDCGNYSYNKQTVLFMAAVEQADAELRVSRARAELRRAEARVSKQEAVVNLLVKASAKEDPKQIRLTRELFRAACRGFTLREGEGYPPYPGGFLDDENIPPSGRPERGEKSAGGSWIEDVLNRGANVNGTDSQGHTALMYAANLGLADNVRELLAKGADPKLKTKDGTTALSLAERKSSAARDERLQVVEILKAHMANGK